MSITKATTLAKKLKVDVSKVMEIVTTKLEPKDWKDELGNVWLFPSGQEKVKLAIEVPLAVPKVLEGFVLYDARNPNYVMCKIDGMENKHPVGIKRKMHGKLTGKRICIHAITDTKGTTYRHAPLTGHHY